jgi:hypothetical protein
VSIICSLIDSLAFLPPPPLIILTLVFSILIAYFCVVIALALLTVAIVHILDQLIVCDRSEFCSIYANKLLMILEKYLAKS